jgi:nitrous oxidase accessory protein NosD
MRRPQHLVLLLALAAALGSAAPRGQQSAPVAGLVVSGSAAFRAGTYAVHAADLDHPAIVIRASNAIVDFTGVVLEGAPPGADPDSVTGLAVLVDGGENVTLRNLTARGYKVGILARHSKRLHITGADLSYNWKSRLYSLVEHESLVDWLSYHQNEHDEWLAGGAGIYIADSEEPEVDRTTIVQGQNGLMLVRSNGGRVWNNTCSFLSGIGIGLYRSNANRIMHNKVDWCVRGYSHTFYNRGQDSAGILVDEQSSRNVIAFNSVTHGGDGLFLWAGQSTMDTGQGGANDNVVYQNDFSFAPANGIEATFSRNVFYENLIEGCWHGLWGGYSFDSWIAANAFRGNAEGIAIEHGQDNRITENTFDGDETAIRLWKNAAQDPAWEYPKRRDTRSRDYVISGNRFVRNKTAMNISETQNVRALTNAFDDVGSIAVLSGDTRNLGIGDEVTVPIRSRPTLDAALPSPLPGGMETRVPEGERRGRDAIIVDEWGPYDWKSPKLWPVGRSDAMPLRLRVLGPPGEWRVASVRGAGVTPQSGRVPGEITVVWEGAPPKRTAEAEEAPSSRIVDVDVRLTYRGAAVTTPRGETTPEGQPYTFGYSRFFVPIDWDVRYFGFDEASAPDAHPDAFARVLSGAPLKIDRRDRLDFLSGRAIVDGVPQDRLAIAAQGRVDLPRGEYLIRTISDDGIRVWVDEERVIDHWTPHESTVDTAPLTGGTHRMKVEYFELGGFAELRLEILKR